MGSGLERREGRGRKIAEEIVNQVFSKSEEWRRVLSKIKDLQYTKEELLEKMRPYGWEWWDRAGTRSEANMILTGAHISFPEREFCVTPMDKTGWYHILWRERPEKPSV